MCFTADVVGIRKKPVAVLEPATARAFGFDIADASACETRLGDPG